MDRSQRPPQISVKPASEADPEPGMQRESSLLPGMVRTPARLFAIGQEIDWAAPGSSVWEDNGRSAESKPIQTPLTGYGRSSEVWASATASPLLDDTAAEGAAGAFEGAVPEGGGPQEYGNPQGDGRASAAALAAAALEALGVEAGPYDNTVPNPSAGGPFSTNAVTATAASSHRPAAHQPYAMQPTYFTVQEGVGETSRGTGSGMTATGISVTEHRGHPNPMNVRPPTAPAAGAAAAHAVPTLEDKQVAQSIIASAGLPLSMTSLLAYIKEGQPQLHDQAGQETAVYGTNSAHRNYPNLSEPPTQPPQMPPQQQQQLQQPGGVQGYGMRGGYGGGTGNPHSMGGGPQMRQGFGMSTATPMSGGGYSPNANANGNWMGVAERGGTGGWNVQAAGPNARPGAPASQPYAPAHPSNRGGGFHVTAGPNGYASPNVVPSQFVPQQQPPMGSYASPAGPYMTGPHPPRPKTDSEILSDLLHFHANFFPPPPPPRVPNTQKRSRAALWYHYASKWDITHRLPPPPRNPLPEMELEYIMQLPEMTRVPYHGDGWLTMGERWFAVTQSLFDFPDENVGVELDASVVMEQAVTS